MALPGSGSISLSQVNVEIGRASNASINMNESAVRGIAGVSSGAISMNNFYGKSAWTLSLPNYNYYNSGSAAAYQWTVPVTVTGHSSTPTFNWVVSPQTYTWAITGGQGTGSCSVRVVVGQAEDSGQATLTCTVTVAGASKSISTTLTYYRTSVGGAN